MENKEPLYWGGFTKAQVLEFAHKYVGENWLKNLSQDELDSFVVWARETGVYFPYMEKSWDAFRGYCIGLRKIKRLTKKIAKDQLKIGEVPMIEID